MVLLWLTVSLINVYALLYKYRSFFLKTVNFLKRNKKIDSFFSYIDQHHNVDRFIKPVKKFVKLFYDKLIKKIIYVLIGKENVSKNIGLNEVILNQWIYYSLPIMCCLPQIIVFSFFLKTENISTGLLFSILFCLILQFFLYIFILGKIKTYENNLRYRITNLVDILVKITVIAGLFAYLTQHDKDVGEYLIWLILISTSLISYQGALKYHFDVIDIK